ncbi:MAG: hypothetical protein IJS47_01745 [Clostridia bacterium]|nr:hypothetical protein [Clostridia bacterium]
MEIFLIVGIIGIIVITVVLLQIDDTSKSGAQNNPKKKKNKKVHEKTYPVFYAKDCGFFADPSAAFLYDQKDLDALIEKYEEVEKTTSYDEIIKLCDEIIKINYTIRKAWVDKINALFNKITFLGDEFDENSARLIINACNGFLKTFDDTLNRTVSARHVLLPILIKDTYDMINYQRENLSELFNFEVYNFLVNLFSVMPFNEILDFLEENLHDSRNMKVVRESEYGGRCINSFFAQLKALKDKYNIEDVETTEDLKNIKIHKGQIINDEYHGTSWIGFSVEYPSDIVLAEISCKFYDDLKNEIYLSNDPEKQFSDIFELQSKDKRVEKFNIVVFGSDEIRSVEFKLAGEEEQVKPKAIEEVQEFLEEEDKKDAKESEESNEVQANKSLEKVTSIPDFSDIVEIALSELHFLALKNDGTVISFGENSNLINTSSWENIVKIYANNSASYGIKSDGSIVIADKNVYDAWEHQYTWTNVVKLAPANNFLLALKNDGTVVSVGNNEHGECNVKNWTDIVDISTSFHSVGLRKDGTVVATGENSFGECNVEYWEDIVQIATGAFYTVGLKKDGTVVATGLNSGNQCNVEDWTNVNKIFARGNITVGITNDGKVLITGNNSYRFEDIKKWFDIEDIIIANERIIGIRADGTVLYKGKPYKGVIERDFTNIKAIAANSTCVVGLQNDNGLISNNVLFGKYITSMSNMPLDIRVNEDIGKTIVLRQDNAIDVYNVSNIMEYNWDSSRFTDLVAIDLSDTHMVGIKSDGTAVINGVDINLAFDVEAWRNLVKVEMGSGFCVGLKIDGKVVAAGNNLFGQCDVSWWSDVIDIKVSGLRTFGLKSDGTVLLAGLNDAEQEFIKMFNNIVQIAVNKTQVMLLNNKGNIKLSNTGDEALKNSLDKWTNIKKIATMGEEFIGLRNDGTMVTTFTEESELDKITGVEDFDVNDMYVIIRKK